MIDDANSDDRYRTVDGVRMRYRRAGRGPALLLLHGTTSSLEHYDTAATRLEDSFDVIRPDLPGFGLTGARGDRDYRISTYAQTIAQFMVQLEIPSYAVAGNSLGGNIAWNMALDHPHAVRALIVVNATGYPEKKMPLGMRLARNPIVRPAMRAVMPRSVVGGGLRQAVGPRFEGIVDDMMVNRVHRLWNHDENRSAFVDFVNTDQRDRTAELSRIDTPTLVLRSAGIDGQPFAADIPGSSEAVHPDAGHLLPEEDPTWFADQVATFLFDLDGRLGGDLA